MDYPSFCDEASKKSSTLGDAPGWYVRLRVGRRGGTETTRELPTPCTPDQVRELCDQMLDTYLDADPCYLELLQTKGTRSHGSCKVEPDGLSENTSPATPGDLMGAILRTNELLARQVADRERAWSSTLEQLVVARIRNAETEALQTVIGDEQRGRETRALMQEFMSGAKMLLDRQVNSPADAIRMAEELVQGMEATAVKDGRPVALSPIEIQRLLTLGERLQTLIAQSMSGGGPGSSSSESSAAAS